MRRLRLDPVADDLLEQLIEVGSFARPTSERRANVETRPPASVESGATGNAESLRSGRFRSCTLQVRLESPSPAELPGGIAVIRSYNEQKPAGGPLFQRRPRAAAAPWPGPGHPVPLPQERRT